jgi:ATP-binding cassette subfamily B protein
VRDNLAFGKKGVTDEEIKKACRAAGIHRFIESLPQGYDTLLTDDSNMSAGQRQLMTIARAMIADAPFLILDEATSSVDTRTEQQVQEAMNRLTEGRTSFTIAHRLSTIRDADVIIVMRDGDIAETGSHEELLKAGGFYAELWNSQFNEGAAI